MHLDRENYSYEAIKHLIAEKGLKVTHQRILILEAFILANEHPTAELLYNQAKEKSPTLSLGTVYKTLDAFTEAGLINRVKTDEDTVRYDANTEKHHHLYCEKTHQIIDYEDEELEQLINDYFKRKGIKNFEVKDFQLQLTGELKDKKLQQGKKHSHQA